MLCLSAIRETTVNLRSLTRILAVITCIGSYFIVLLGTLVTTTNSGQGCGGTWPFCHGQIIPGTLTVAGVIEYGHRIMASADGILVLVLTIATWLLYRQDFRAKFFAAMSLLFIVIQGALGAVTVVFEGTLALPWILSVHFGLSLIAFASVVLLTIRLFQLNREQQGATPQETIRKLQSPVWGLIAYTFIVTYTGALVEHTGAITGCGTQIPLCGSTFLPGFTSLAGIQLLHRYVAGLLWFLVLALLITIIRRYSIRRDITRGAWWAFILITLQAMSGMTTVFTGGQLLASLMHATIISGFFSVLCYLGVQVGWPWTRKKQPQPVVDEKQLNLHTVS